MWKWNTFSTADHCQWTGVLKYNNNRLCFTWAPARSQVNTAELFASVGVGATVAPVSACLIGVMAAVYEHCPRPDGWGCIWSGLLSRRMSLQIPHLSPSHVCHERQSFHSVVLWAQGSETGLEDPISAEKHLASRSVGKAAPHECRSSLFLSCPCLFVTKEMSLEFYCCFTVLDHVSLYISGSDVVGRDPKMRCRSVLMLNANNQLPLTR